MYICLHLKLPLKVWFGEQQKSMVMLVWSVAVLSCRFLVSMQTVQRELNSGFATLVCLAGVPALSFRFDNLNVAGTIGRLLDRSSLLNVNEYSR